MRKTVVKNHVSEEEVKERMNKDSNPLYRQRWRIIYHFMKDEEETTEKVALHCGVSKDTVHQLISRYNRFGVKAVETPGKGGRRRYYLTLEEEREFLQPFFEQAKKGEIATCGEIHAAFEARVAHTVDESTIYHLLNRHQWRKVLPRPKHPNADREKQEAFKKTSQPSSKKLLPQNR